MKILDYPSVPSFLLFWISVHCWKFWNSQHFLKASGSEYSLQAQPGPFSQCWQCRHKASDLIQKHVSYGCVAKWDTPKSIDVSSCSLPTSHFGVFLWFWEKFNCPVQIVSSWPSKSLGSTLNCCNLRHDSSAKMALSFFHFPLVFESFYYFFLLVNPR